MIIATKVNFGKAGGVVFKSNIVNFCEEHDIQYEYDEIGDTGVLAAVFLDVNSDSYNYNSLILMLEEQGFEAK